MRDIVFVAVVIALLPPGGALRSRLRGDRRTDARAGRRMSVENVVGLVLGDPRARLPDLRAHLPGAARMSSYSWLQLGVLIAILLVTTRVLGAYVAGVFGGEQGAGRPRLRSRSSESSTASAASTRTASRRWTVYAFALLAFSARLRARPLRAAAGPGLRCRSTRPTSTAVPPALAFNTAASLRHQHELAELRRRVDDEPSDADGRARRCRTSSPPPSGIAVAVALIRGFVRRRSATIGNFWVDLTRDDDPGPAAARRSSSRSLLVEPGRRPEPPRLHRTRTTVAGRDAVDPGRPDREPGGDQGARHERRRPLQRELGAPVREPERRSRTSSRSSRSC